MTDKQRIAVLEGQVAALQKNVVDILKIVHTLTDGGMETQRVVQKILSLLLPAAAQASESTTKGEPT